MSIRVGDGRRAGEWQGARWLRQAIAAVVVICFVPLMTAAPTALTTTAI